MHVDLKLTVSPKKTKSSKTTISVETGENAESASRRCIVHYTKFDKETRVSEFTEVSWKKVKEAK